MFMTGYSDSIRQIYELSVSFQSYMVSLATALLGIFLMVEILKEAIDLASGRGFHLDKKLIMMLVAGIGVAAGFQSFARGIYNLMYEYMSKEIHIISVIDEKLMKQVKIFFKTCLNASMNFLNPSGMIGESLTYLGVLIGFMAIIAAIILIDVMILGAFVGLAFTLHAGPVFVVFLGLEETRSWFFTWLANLLSYFVQFFFMSMAIKIGNHFLEKSVETLDNLMYAQIANMAPKFFDAIFGPLFLLSCILISKKVAGSLFSVSTAGGAEAAGPFAMGAKVASSVGRTIGGVATRVIPR